MHKQLGCRATAWKRGCDRIDCILPASSKYGQRRHSYEELAGRNNNLSFLKLKHYYLFKIFELLLRL